VPETFAPKTILGSEEEPNGTLFVLFIPSKDKNGKALNDQDMWANAAGDLLAKLLAAPPSCPLRRENG